MAKIRCEQIIEYRPEVVEKSIPDGYVIWKDERQNFPYGSRLIVDKDTVFALVKRNGVTSIYKHADDPRFENGMPLADWMSGEERLTNVHEVGAVHTLALDILWVAKKSPLPLREWTGFINIYKANNRIEGRIKKPSEAMDFGGALAQVKSELKLNVEVIDPKVFYKNIGFEKYTWKQLLKFGDKDSSLEKLFEMALEAVRQCLEEKFDPENNLGIEQTVFQECVESAINESYKEWGLKITDFVFGCEVTWNEQISHQNQRNGKDELLSIIQIVKALESCIPDMVDEMKRIKNSVENMGNTSLAELDKLRVEIINIQRSVSDSDERVKKYVSKEADRIITQINEKINETLIQLSAKLDEAFREPGDLLQGIKEASGILKIGTGCDWDRLSHILNDSNEEFDKDMCDYMGFNNIKAFEDFISDTTIDTTSNPDDLKMVIFAAFRMAKMGGLDGSSTEEYPNYSLYSFMMGYLYEKLVKRYYEAKVFIPFIKEHNKGYYNIVFDKKRKENPNWYPELSIYSAGPRHSDEYPNDTKWSVFKKAIQKQLIKKEICQKLFDKFKLEPLDDYEWHWWQNLLNNMNIANARRNSAAHISSPITKEQAEEFFSLMFKGGGSLMRRLIMIQRVQERNSQ